VITIGSQVIGGDSGGGAGGGSSAATDDVTYALGGSSYDFTADAEYAPTGIHAGETNTSGALGGNAMSLPVFNVVGRHRVAALARTATGLRMTAISVLNFDSWLYASNGANLIFALPAGIDWPHVVADVRLAANFASLTAPTGSAYLRAAAGFLRATPESYGTRLVAANIRRKGDVNGAAVGFVADTDQNASTSATADLSGATYTSGGVTTVDLRLAVEGLTVSAGYGPPGGAITTAVSRSDSVRRGPGVMFVVSLGSNYSNPAGAWLEVQSLRFRRSV
jgi:hypothetical protein